MKKITLALVAIAMIATMSISAPTAEADTGDTINICVKTKTNKKDVKITVIKISDRDDHGGFQCEATPCTTDGRFCIVDECDVKKSKRRCVTTAAITEPEAPKAPQQDYPTITNAPTSVVGDNTVSPDFDQAALDAWAAANPAPAYVAHDYTPANVDPAVWAAYLAG